MDEDTMTCGVCGRSATGEALETARATWSFGVERGRAMWTCDVCSRTHARSIEGKLDSQWW